jgi:DNA-binding protein H-NS
MTETIQALEQEHAAAKQRADELAAQIAKEKAERRAQVLADIKADIETFGYIVSELFADVPQPRVKKATKARKPTALAAKYRDNESGDTWVGRGKRPGWLVQALKNGKTLADFAIQG